MIDLRAPSEDRGDEAALKRRGCGLTYVPIPVTEDTPQDAKTPRPVHPSLQRDEKPVLVHCAAGGRVAAVYYAWLVAEKKMSRGGVGQSQEEGLRRETYIAPINAYLDQKKSEP